MSEVTEVTLRPAVVSRLHQLYMQLDGAKIAAQAAVEAHNQLLQRLNQGIADACADEGMLVRADVPPGVTIDWDTGIAKVNEQSPNGTVEHANAV